VDIGLGFIGNFADGVPVGKCWRELRGGAWLYGQVDQQGFFTGYPFYVKFVTKGECRLDPGANPTTYEFTATTPAL
jgi:hypothetical protein